MRSKIKTGTVEKDYSSDARSYSRSSSFIYPSTVKIDFNIAAMRPFALFVEFHQLA